VINLLLSYQELMKIIATYYFSKLLHVLVTILETKILDDCNKIINEYRIEKVNNVDLIISYLLSFKPVYLRIDDLTFISLTFLPLPKLLLFPVVGSF